MTPEHLNNRQYAMVFTVAVLGIGGIAGMLAIMAIGLWVAVGALL
jgi:hypothetical protein